MQTQYFTFGQSHVHTINGFTFDKDVIVEITSKDPRATMFQMFGAKWSMQYNTPPNLKLFPRGIVKLKA